MEHSSLDTNNINLILGILVLLLILISAFFSLVEISLTTCSRAKIHRLAKDGNSRAIMVDKLLKNSESAMGTILLCNNTINILSSAIATGVLIKIFGNSGVIYATIIMTVLVLIFGEIAPKTYALKHAEKIILFSAPSILLLIKFFTPITKNIQIVIDKVFDFFSPKTTHNEKGRLLISDLEEIRGTIDLKHRSGSIIKYDKDMLDSILDLGETEIGNVMIHRKNIFSINIDQTLEAILKQAFYINHSRIPLWKNTQDNIVSVIDLRKLVTVLHANNGDIKKLKLEQFTIDPWFVPTTNTLRNQLVAYRKRKEKFAIVIDEYGTLMGVITLEDILEEIVGDIEDPEDIGSQLKLVKLKDNSYKISGDSPLRDINRKLNWDLPEDEENASTLAGLLISKIEKIPEEKEEFKIDNFRFKVLKMDANRITFLKVSLIQNDR